jgi:hypothetical protein
MYEHIKQEAKSLAEKLEEICRDTGIEHIEFEGAIGNLRYSSKMDAGTELIIKEAPDDNSKLADIHGCIANCL